MGGLVIPVNQANLVQPVDPLLHRDVVLRNVQVLDVQRFVALQQGLPGLLRWVVFGRRRYAEVVVVVIGPDDETVALVVNRVLVPYFPGSNQYRFGRWIIRRDQPVLAGDVVAGANDDVFVGVGARDPEEESRIGLLIYQGVLFDRSAKDVAANLVRVSGLVQLGVIEVRVIRGPDSPSPGFLDGVGKYFPGSQVFDDHGVAFRPIGICAVNDFRPVLGHRKGSQAEVLEPLSQFRLIQEHDRVVRRPLASFGVRGGPSQPFPVLAPLAVFPLVVPVPALAGQAGQLGGLAALDLGINRVNQGLVGRHNDVEIVVLRLQVGDDVLVVHRGVVLVLQPVPRVLHGDAVMGVAVRTLPAIGGTGSAETSRVASGVGSVWPQASVPALAQGRLGRGLRCRLGCGHRVGRFRRRLRRVVQVWPQGRSARVWVVAPKWVLEPALPWAPGQARP